MPLYCEDNVGDTKYVIIKDFRNTDTPRWRLSNGPNKIMVYISDSMTAGEDANFSRKMAMGQEVNRKEDFLPPSDNSCVQKYLRAPSKYLLPLLFGPPKRGLCQILPSFDSSG